MPGLLDFANTDDGMQGLGLLAAAAPSMAPMNLAGRLAQAAQGYGGLKDAAIKRQELQQEMAMKQLQVQQATQKWAMMQPLLQRLVGGGTAPAAASADAGMPSADNSRLPSVMRLPGVPNMLPEQGAQPGTQPAQSGGFPLSFNEVTALKTLGGPDLLKELEIGQSGYEQKPGSFYKMPNGEMRYVDDPKTGMKYDSRTNSMQPISGYAEAMARQKGMETAATKGAEARYTPLSPEFKTPDGRPVGGNAADYLSGGAAEPAPAAPAGMAMPGAATLAKIPASVQAGRDGDKYTIIKQEYDNERDPASKAALGRELMRLSAAAQSKGGIKLQSTSEAAQQAADVTLKNQPALKSATDLAGGDAANFNEYKKTLNKAVETGYQQYQRNLMSEQLMEAYKTGLPNPESRSAFASTLKNTFPNSAAARALAEKVNGGDVGNGQMLANLLSSSGLTNVIRTLDGNGRVNKAEYQALQEHAEKNRSDPDALLGIMHYQNNAFKQDYAEQQALAKHEEAGTVNPKTWQATYSKTRMDNLAQPGALPATPAQANAKAQPAATGTFAATVNGKTYNFPTQKALANFKLEAGIK